MIETYGKTNKIKKGWIELKERFKPNKHTENILKNKGLGVYIPRLNKLRVGVGLVLVGVCLITPATNWTIPFIVGWALK